MPIQRETSEALVALTNRIFNPTTRELEKTIITNVAKEQRQRQQRLKSVCAKWEESGWYRDNVLPPEHSTLESWLKVSNTLALFVIHCVTESST